MSLVSEVADKSFDYVIAGGGTAALTLATRLTENPNVTVAVLEAGQPNINDPAIIVPAQWGMTFGNPKYDWFFQTTPQKNANDMTYAWNRGKGLGGSSGLNFYVWVKPPAQDFNAIEKLGNPTWNWDEFFKYTRKCETFHEPNLEHHKTFDHTFIQENRGRDGPIQTCIPYHTTLEKPWQETMVNFGAEYIKDPYGGNITGTWVCTNNLDPRTHTRSYSTTGYYLPNAGRPNLTVLTEALVHKIVTKPDVNGNLTATGVEFGHEGKTYVVHAKKEVISSAGALKTPQLLELSGIGRKSVLEPLGIDCKIDLPGVGENLQEHMLITTVWKLKPDSEHDTFDLMRTPGFAEEQKRLHAENKGMHRLGLTSFAYLPWRFAFANGEEKKLIEDKVAELEKNKDKFPPGLWEQYKIQIENLRDEAVPDLELAVFPGFYTTAVAPEENAKYVSALGVLNHPFSRGDVHIKSTNPEEYPVMDAHYFEDEFDMTNMISHLKLCRRIREIEPFKSMVAEEVAPGPELQTDEQLRDFVCKHMTTAWHGLGTTAMLPREHAGVVDPQLKVYGTNNLRVVDLGIIPLHLATHTHSVAYVIGEKAADIIKATW